jgi:hypothetical protein
VLLAIGAALGLVQLGWAILLAASLSVSIWLTMSPVMRQIDKLEFVKGLLQSLAVATASVAASTAAFLWHDGPALHLMRLAIGVSSATLAFVLAVFLIRHPLRDELRRMLDMVGRPLGT